MKFTKTIIFISLFILISCKEDKNNEVSNKESEKNSLVMSFDINKIKEQIEIQKNVETEEEEKKNPYNLNKKDLEFATLLIEEELNKRGFKKINSSDFTKKTELIFKLNHKKPCKNYNYSDDITTLFGLQMDGNIKTLLDNQFDLFINTQNYFLENKKCFMLNMFLLKDLIKINDKNEYNLTVPQRIVEENKYLFNENKASFAWLKINDSEFLEMLVKTFGYFEDKELSKFVLDKNLKDNEEFGKVIWNKTCNGKLHFNDEVVTLIKGAPSKYTETVENYLGFLLNKDTELEFSIKAEIMGKLAYYTTKAVDPESNDYFKFFTFVGGEEFQEEFKKKNYYNITDFQSIYEETKTGGVAYPGME